MLPNMNMGGLVAPPGPMNLQPGPFNIPGMPVNNMISKVNSNDAILYVGNLHPSMDESRLYEIFIAYGPIKNCKLMKDLYTQESRGFAFITFVNQDDAQKAKDELNYQKFEDWEMRICFKKSPSDFKDESNIFIKNLSSQVTTKQLDEMCSKYGEVLSCIIRNNEKGQSLGYGYVQFSSEEEATKAIESLNETELEGQQIIVSKFVPSKNRQTAKKNIYMKNFPSNWKKEDVEKFIKDKIESQGETTCTGVYTSQKDDEPEKFYAFVAFEEESVAEKIIEEYKDKKLAEDQEEEFYIGYAQSKKQRKDLLKKEFQTSQNQTNIFVKSLKNDTTEEQLKEAFSEYGTITSLFIKKMETKVPYTDDPLKFGFINFKTPDMAKQAIINYTKNALLKNLIHDKHNTNIPYVCFAQSKRVRLAYLKMKKKMQNFDHFSLIGNPFQQNQSNLPINGMMGAPLPFQPVGMPAFPPANNQMRNNKNLDFGLSTPSQEMSNPTSVPNERIKDVYNLTWLKQNQQEFLNFDEEKQRNILGELMYEKVVNSGLTEQNQVSKITGMLIDLDILEFEEILDILENEDSLHERINEAQEVILESDF